jgi:hypothetical protein
MRLFGLDEARKFVPHLLEVFGRVRGWLDEARQRALLLENKEIPREERMRLDAEISTYAARIRDELAKLEEAGIEIKSVDGLIDFRATLEDRQVFLCWKYPEDTVAYWHELGDGFAGRQQIEEGQSFRQSFVS